MIEEQDIKKLCELFFEKLHVDYKELTLAKEEDTVYRITLKSDDSHILIGPHGKNLESISHILKLIVSKTTGTHANIHVEVNDYLEQKNEKLFQFIQSKIDYVKKSGKEIILPFFTAYERKKVHSLVSEKWGSVYTLSHGEGNNRRIHLCKKDEKMTIDIDGDTI